MNTGSCNFRFKYSAFACHATHLADIYLVFDSIGNVHILACKFRSPQRLILWTDAPVTFVRRSTVLSALPRGSWSWRPGWIISLRSSSSRSAATWVPSAIPRLHISPSGLLPHSLTILSRKKQLSQRFGRIGFLSSAFCRFCPPSN